MDIKELRTLSKEKLNIRLLENREKLRELRFKDSNHQLKNVKEISAVKKEIARILTILNQSK